MGFLQPCQANISSVVTDEKLLAQFYSQWYEFCNSKTQLEAETHIQVIKNMIEKQENTVTRNKLTSTFKIYFEDPRMICDYGLQNVPEKHLGPAEAEGYQNLFKTGVYILQ